MRKQVFLLLLSGCATAVPEGRFETGLGPGQAARMRNFREESESLWAYFWQMEGPTMSVVDRNTGLGGSLSLVSWTNPLGSSYFGSLLPVSIFWMPLVRHRTRWPVNICRTSIFVQGSPLLWNTFYSPPAFMRAGLHSPLVWPFSLDAGLILGDEGLVPYAGVGFDLTLWYKGAVIPETGQQGKMATAGCLTGAGVVAAISVLLIVLYRSLNAID